MSLLADAGDAVLIRMAGAGRSDCFSILMDRHLTAIKRYLRTILPNIADQEDILQEVLVKVWRHLGAFRLESNLRTWMMQIAINEVRAFYRRRKCRPEFQPLENCGPIASIEASPERDALRNEAARKVHSGLAVLPVKYREVLILRYFEEKTGEDTARTLGMTLPAAKTRTFRARRLLSQKLRRLKRAA
jgi:RNA polymerase sigma-70 factor, ECF subfamily